MKVRNFIFSTLLASSLMLPALSAYAKHEAELGDDRGGDRTCQSITVKRDDSKANDNCRRSNDDSLAHQRHGTDDAGHQRHGTDDAGGHGNDDGPNHKSSKFVEPCCGDIPSLQLF